MQTVLIVVHLIIVLGLIAVVLLQRSEGGLGLGGGGGVSGFMTGRGQANALTRATAILAGLFFLTSLVLSIIAHRGGAPRSILEGSGRPASSAPASGGVLDELQRLQGSASPGSAPANPAAPVPTPAAPAPQAPAAPQVPQTR